MEQVETYEGNYDPAMIDAWLEQYDDTLRYIFLDATDLVYESQLGTLAIPLRCNVINDDSNRELVVAKREYFRSGWFKALPDETKEALFRYIGLPSEIRGEVIDKCGYMPKLMRY